MSSESRVAVFALLNSEKGDNVGGQMMRKMEDQMEKRDGHEMETR